MEKPVGGRVIERLIPDKNVPMLVRAGYGWVVGWNLWMMSSSNRGYRMICGCDVSVVVIVVGAGAGNSETWTKHC